MAIDVKSLKLTGKDKMRTINICFKVPGENASEVEEVLKAHAEHMKVNYTPDNPRGDNPLDAYFTKAEELNNPTNPADGKTGNILFTVNEKWAQPEHIQAHIGRTMKATHFSKILSAMQNYGTISVMGEVFYDLKQ